MTCKDKLKLSESSRKLNRVMVSLCSVNKTYFLISHTASLKYICRIMLDLKHRGKNLLLYFTQMGTLLPAVLNTVFRSWTCWSSDLLPFGYLFNHAVLYCAETVKHFVVLHVVSTVLYYCSNWRSFNPMLMKMPDKYACQENPYPSLKTD